MSYDGWSRQTTRYEPTTKAPTTRPHPDLKYDKCPTCKFYNKSTKNHRATNPDYCGCTSMCVDGGDEYIETIKIDNQMRHITHDPNLYDNNTDSSVTTTQSFDQIIMECQDMLSVETEVKKAYEKWLGVRVKKRGKLKLDVTDNQFEKGIRRSFKLLPFTCLLPFTFLFGLNWMTGLSVIGGAVLCYFTVWFDITYHWGDWKLAYIKGTTEPKRQPTEQNKFQFLKESYVGTIQKLDDRLDIIKAKINTQIDAHTQDKEQVLQYQDMFDETDSVLHKIERAISSLRDSHDKVSEKKAELNKTLTDYIGENGYISQKEQELERIKVAQELSDRMQTNFGKTMEIVKNVDVLTDAIIPGIKQLMEFRIPELIEKVEFECDRERVMLEGKG